MIRSRIFAFILISLVVLIACNERNNSPSTVMFVPEKNQRLTDYFRFAPAVQADNFVFVSGVTGRLAEGAAASDEAYASAIRDVFVEIENILAEAGCDWSDVVDMTSYHVDMRAHQEIFRKVREEFITSEPYPAWTAIGVEKLWLDELFIEVKVVAYKPN